MKKIYLDEYKERKEERMRREENRRDETRREISK